MNTKRKSSYVTLVVLFMFSFVVIRSMSYSSDKLPKPKHSEEKFHTEKEIQKIKDIFIQRGPIEPGEYFLHSFNCTGCHGYDSTGYANVDENGVDVNLVDDWRATMMALSAKDPFWRAKVSHEILVNPMHSLDLQNKCTSCHAPMGHYTAMFKGQSHYTLANLYADSLGLDGVSCLACHTIGTDGLGTVFSGHIPYDTSLHAYGPFTNPVTGPMQLYEGFTPAYSQHVSESRFCSPCHTLLTSSVDLAGNLTGRKFVEQATFHEWVNSTYAADEITCQSCHMPKTTDSIRIANNQFNLEKRFPFNKHKFQGGNSFMVKLMKQNKTTLQLEDIPDKNFDTSINIIIQNLQQNTLNMDLVNDSIVNDTAYFSVKLINRAGHKFPSGYPSRRAVVQFLVTANNNQDTLFKSGIFDNNFEVQNINPVFEPHHDFIISQNQTQIYEMVMGDVNGDKTTVLARADTMLKDNRLVPEGFTSLSSVYDTTKIVLGINDDNFNKYNGGMEGSGWDIIQYRIPLNGFNQIINIYSKVYYQSLPPAYLAEMFTYTSTEIDNFKNMYIAADKSPVCVVADSILNINLGMFEQELTGVNVWPNPTNDGWIQITWDNNIVDRIYIYTVTGQLAGTYFVDAALNSCKIQLPRPNTTYLVDIRSGYKRTVNKIIRN